MAARWVRVCITAVALWLPAQGLSSEQALREHLVADYDRGMPPGLRVEPTRVAAEFSLSSLWGINQQLGQFSVDLYIRLIWNDPRLAYQALNVSLLSPWLDLSEVREKVWKPDDFFLSNAVDFEQPANEFLLRVAPSGDVVWSRRFLMTLKCKMYFGSFPFDTQTCPIHMELYKLTAADAVLAIDTVPEKMFDKIQTNEWNKFTGSYDSGVTDYHGVMYSWATISFEMHRRSGFWVNNGILNSALIVFLSYCGFWIDPAAAPGRIALSVICVLVALTSSLRISSAMPVLSYDVWLIDYLLGCILFNFTAVLSYSMVNYGRTAKASLKPEDPEGGREACRVKCVRFATQLDWHMRWLFPLAFAVFNIVMFSIQSSYQEEM